MTPFLYRVGMSKLFSSSTVGFNSITYDAFCFMKGPTKTKHDILSFFFFSFFFNWDSLHARLNSHHEAWSYKKKKHEKITTYRKSV